MCSYTTCDMYINAKLMVMNSDNSVAWLYDMNNGCEVLTVVTRGEQILQKSRSQLKILGARRVTKTSAILRFYK
jgi:hypothetical protein